MEKSTNYGSSTISPSCASGYVPQNRDVQRNDVEWGISFFNKQ